MKLTLYVFITIICVLPVCMVSTSIVYHVYDLGSVTWDKVFKSEFCKFCGIQPLKNLLSPLLNP